MRLSSVLADAGVVDSAGDADPDIVDVTFNSDAVRAGSLFCCLPGRTRDGHDFAGEAAARGAVALLVERPVEVSLPQARVIDARRAMAMASATLHGHPSRALTVVGVTGTNGKTTTAHLIKAIFDGVGRRCGLVGTMNNARTTPESPDLQRLLSDFLAAACTTAAIEVSSVGLVQQRVEATSFAASVFTNLSPDELWIHGTMEEYYRAKAMLFDPDRTALGVINRDDEWGTRLAAESEKRLPTVVFAARDASDVRLETSRSSFRWRGIDVEVPLEGEFNVMNALAALTTCVELGVEPQAAVDALAAMEQIAGHGEEVAIGQPFRVIVDFAHTSGALAAVLESARRTARPAGGKVIVVFGCGGDRDPGRREPMGEEASRRADVVVITSDNPRTEDPMAILEGVHAGAKRGSATVVIEPDRRAAIERAISGASDGDVIVIAGKGHETGQTIGTTTLPFDDRSVAVEVLQSLGFEVPST